MNRRFPILENKGIEDRKSTRLNSSHLVISYAVFCLKKKKKKVTDLREPRKPYSSTPRSLAIRLLPALPAALYMRRPAELLAASIARSRRESSSRAS